MMSELRWALLILGVLFIVALTVWERRRPRQASGALERMPLREGGTDSAPRHVREPPLTLPEMRAREPLGAPLRVVGMLEEPAGPVLEPAAPRDAAEPAAPWDADGSAHRDPVHDTREGREWEDADDPEHAEGAGRVEYSARTVTENFGSPARYADNFSEAGDVLPEVSATHTVPLEAEDAEPAPDPGSAERQALPELPPGVPLLVDWPAEHERRILALRLVAPQRERFAGRSLRQALAAEGFLLGQFAIFHKPDDERRAVLSAASLTRPGTFDMETMDSQHYGGLSLFAVLPGPKPARQAFDELVFAARNLNERLHGVLQDEQGTPLTPARIAQLREQVRAGAGS